MGGFLGGVRDFFNENPWASYALPLATSTLMPGLGNTVGSAVSNGLGLDLSPTATQALGNALSSGALGALTGGTKGALTGALIGGFTPYAAGMLGLGGGMAGSMPTTEQGGYGPDVPKSVDTSSGSSSSGSSGGALSSLFGGSGSLSKAIPLLALAGVMGGALSGGKSKNDEGAVVSDEQQAVIARQNKPLSEVKFTRSKQPIMPKGDPLTYGYGPEHTFYKNNRVPYARGGDVGGALSMAHHPEARYIESHGNPGRSDRIPALLSDNEYVIDAETVALLGDGSPDAGAKALDAMRANIRRHKGGALSSGRISPDAKPALAYLSRGRH